MDPVSAPTLEVASNVGYSLLYPTKHNLNNKFHKDLTNIYLMRNVETVAQKNFFWSWKWKNCAWLIIFCNFALTCQVGPTREIFQVKTETNVILDKHYGSLSLGEVIQGLG